MPAARTTKINPFWLVDKVISFGCGANIIEPNITAVSDAIMAPKVGLK